MLGFSAFSQTPFAQASTSLTALAFMASAASQGYAGVFGYDAKAFYTLNPVVSSTAVAIEFDAKASANVLSVLSSLSINDLLDVDAQATTSPSAVAATFSADTLSYDAKANLTLGSVTSDILAYDLADVDAQASTTLDATTTTITPHQFTAFYDVKGKFSAYPSGAATATFSLAADANGKANIVTSASTSTFTAGILDYDAKAYITLDSATADADLTVNDFADEDAQATATLSGVSLTTSTNWDTVNGVYAIQVIYLNTDFERKRTVNVVPYGNDTVYITRTVEDSTRTVNVVPYGNYTVYVTR